MSTNSQTARLAALIIADDAEKSPLVLGRSLTELQIARVVSTGARHVVCLVRQISSQTLAIADNLRANGLTVDVVRSIADAADAIHPEEAVFLVASQVLVSGKTLEALLASRVSSLLCVENEAATVQFELIDATMRWTGYALLDGATLRRVAAMVGDWDAASTLLRQLVQEDARRVVLSRDQIADAMLAVRDSAEALRAGRKLLGDESIESDGLGEHWLARPIGRFTARLAGELGLKNKPIELAAGGFAVIAALVGLTGWLAAALAILIVGFLARSTAVRLAAATGDLNSYGPVLRSAINVAAVAVVCACAVTLGTRSGQWGCFLLGGLLVGAQLLVAQRRPNYPGVQTWLCDPLSAVTIMLIGFASTLPIASLFLATGHAVASFLWMQRPSANVVAGSP